jgi:hypothetical protein
MRVPLLRQAVRSGDIEYTTHAEDRMIEREITRTQVKRCLLEGRYEPDKLPEVSEHGDWSFRLTYITAGVRVTVVAALDECENGNMSVIVTAF